jgi:excisionase family DNA binding protein
MKRRNRRPDRRRIKSLRSYTFEEAARDLGVHRNTVRHWVKAGLPVIKDKRPYLIVGRDLAEFLTQRREARRQPCQPGQMYCLKCRRPQAPAARMADFVASSAALGALVGICPVCNHLMYRRVSVARLSEAAGALDVQMRQAQPRIGELRLSTSETDVGAKPPSQNAIANDFSGADVGSGGGVNTRAGSASAPLPSPTPLALATRHPTRRKR